MASRNPPPSQRTAPSRESSQMGPPQVPQVPSEEELKRLSQDELVKRLRWCESDRIRRMSEHNAMTKDVNKRMQSHILEIRGLKENNQQLQKDNQELRDLCCFLDDDRQSGKQITKEWQKFGRYTTTVMKTEVDTYPMKLKDLEDKQKQLIQENLELKELCYILDQERSGKRNSICSNCNNSALTLPPRDQGDGSYDNGPSSPRELKNSQIDDHTKAYIQRLEDRIHRLEEEKRLVGQPGTWGTSDGPDGRLPNHMPPAARSTQVQNVPPSSSRQYQAPIENGPPPSTSPTSNKPEAVMHALKVLEVHEQLDKSRQPGSTVGQNENLNDNEKAIVREMCNVVWRKLGDAPPDAAPAPVPQSAEPPMSSSVRPNAPPRHSLGSAGQHAPPRYGNIGGTQQPRYAAGSTNSLDRVPDRKGMYSNDMLNPSPRYKGVTGSLDRTSAPSSYAGSTNSLDRRT